MALYVISDLHLSAKVPDLLQAFVGFTHTLQTNDRLVIAGDLFDFFVGINKKDIAQQTVKEALHEVSLRGIKSFFIRGNRDFLLDKKHAEYFNMELLPDVFTFECVKGRAIITHGDILCTDDIKYQKFRTRCQKVWLRKLFMSLPLSIRLKVGQSIRLKSHTQKKKLNQSAERKTIPYDVTLSAVKDYLKTLDAHVLIHGHIHRLSQIKDEDGNNSLRICLGAWGTTYSYVRADLNGISVVQKPIEVLLKGINSKV